MTLETIEPSFLPDDVLPSRREVRGYTRQRASRCVVFGAQGQFVCVEQLVGLDRRTRGTVSMILPEPVRFGDRRPVSFLWDRPKLASASVLRSKHNAFVAFHRSALRGVTDMALTTFLSFLESSSPGDVLGDPAPDLPADASALVYRFQYDDEFLHERHIARLTWARIIEATSHQTG